LGALLIGAPALAQDPRPVPREPTPREPVPAERTAPADSVPPPLVPLPSRDTLARSTAAADSVPRDTLKAPITVAERPGSPELRGRRYVWDRDAMFMSGALTLPELIAQIPGATVMNAGFVMAPAVASWYGQPGRVRVFLDGVEMDHLDPRSGGTADLSTIMLWPLEEVAAERTAGELRVHLRTWRVELTTAQTRTDVLTGSENINLYRGFFGKRFDSGGVFQIAGQQYSTTSAATRGDGESLGAFLRAGIAREDWTVDAVALRYGRNRTATRRFVTGPGIQEAAIPRFSGRDLTAYIRAAYRNPDANGVWAQVVASTLQYIEDDSTGTGATADLDTVVTQSQWVATAGLTRGGFRLSGTGRLRTQGGESRFSPLVRASWDTRLLELSGAFEGAGPDSTRRLDAIARVQLLPFLHVAGAFSQHAPNDAAAGGPARTTSRGEVGLRVRDRWLTAGVVQRSQAKVLGLPLFDENFGSLLTEAATGLEYGVGGRIWGPFSLEARLIDWGEEGFYRPRVESHTELRVGTALERWLKRRTFYLTAALTHDHRGNFLAPDGAGGTLRADGANQLGTLLDIRIGAAHVFWYNRNFTASIYETVPGYTMPRLVQMYGIRWEFWN
jgi:hypothetical protein